LGKYDETLFKAGACLIDLPSARKPTLLRSDIPHLHRTASLSTKSRSTMATEQTYIMIKPDGVQRGLVADIIGRFEKVGEEIQLALHRFALQPTLRSTHCLTPIRALFFFKPLTHPNCDS
jgi:Nucleoside diphosphate kinase